MSDELESTLGRSLNAIDNIRRRVLAGGWLAVAVTLAAYGYFSVSPTIGTAVAAITCLIAWVGFAIILIVVRMTKRILVAIDLLARSQKA